MVSLADDITGAGKFRKLRKWWDTVVEHGRKLGYYVNEGKSWIIIRDPNNLRLAQEIFEGTGIKFTTEGKRHLGASITTSEQNTPKNLCPIGAKN